MWLIITVHLQLLLSWFMWGLRYHSAPCNTQRQPWGLSLSKSEGGSIWKWRGKTHSAAAPSTFTVTDSILLGSSTKAAQAATCKCTRKQGPIAMLESKWGSVPRQCSTCYWVDQRGDNAYVLWNNTTEKGLSTTNAASWCQRGTLVTPNPTVSMLPPPHPPTFLPLRLSTLYGL